MSISNELPRIICNIHITSNEQDVYIETHEGVERFKMKIDEIPDFIVKSKIGNIYLRGNSLFCMKIESEVREKATKYNALTFHYI